MDEDTGNARAMLGACVLAGLLAPAACSAAAETICPAIGWSNTLTVGLAGDWPPLDGGSLTVECSPRCGWVIRQDEPLTDQDELTLPLTGSSEVVQLDMSRPDSVVVTVLGAERAQLGRVDADLEWRRVGGSEECGGPMAASVVVPAP
jgi:hypothetical protein